MPLNFQKLESIFAENGDGSKVLLPDEQLQTITQFLVASAPWKSWGTSLAVENSVPGSAGTITFGLVLGGDRTAKTTLGAGIAKPTKLKPITIAFDTPYKYFHGFTAYDKARGLAATGAEYSAHYANQELLENGRKVMSDMLTKITANGKVITQDLMSSSVTPDQALDVLTTAAVKVKTFKDANYGIDGVSVGNILIQVTSALFQKIVKTGLLGNRTDQTFTLGMYGVGNIAGYRIEANDYLPDNCQAMIGSTFAWATGDQTLAMKVGNVDTMSNDIGVYNEYCHANGSIVDTVLTAIVAPTTAQTPVQA